MGYRPNMRRFKCEASTSGASEDGKFIEHWDELNLLEVFQQIGAAAMRKPEGQ